MSSTLDWLVKINQYTLGKISNKKLIQFESILISQNHTKVFLYYTITINW
jgi:hypothetical protein